ncbi:hypothetical protein [Hymenobacter properus]|uniref:Uncharacterized protein n=1 Tax=Hymenobacter properus TaxID=2791026 RepID=A0A931BK64_9BACT|nr:hypothetical protein [Hymenobacter properus]MBF9140980.1 hypothetical protein [Hymenobacter properus]MBR7719789.1 hypothetical protein [Microvirga sp. SRT04]
MRYFLLLTAPALLLGATQFNSLPPAPAPAKGTTPAALAAPGAVLPNAARATLLARAQLGKLWQHQPQSGTEDVLNGCYGYDGRRIEFVFTTVQADAKSPGRYLVAGKFRCYGDVTPFRGSVEVQQVQRLPTEQAAYAEADERLPTYCATGSFALQATSHRGLGGRFDGRLALDFTLSPSQRAVLASTSNPATRNGGLLFEGQWREDATAETAVPVLWKQGTAVTRQVLSRFEMGERSSYVNPKYARVGWKDLWENDEWWVEKSVARR